jgi:hypothetical protein
VAAIFVSWSRCSLVANSVGSGGTHPVRVLVHATEYHKLCDYVEGVSCECAARLAALVVFLAYQALTLSRMSRWTSALLATGAKTYAIVLVCNIFHLI